MAFPSDSSWREQLSASAYRFGWAVTKRIPPAIARSMFDCLADLASRNGKGPEQLRRNLSRVVGPENVTRDLVRRSMRSYLRYWREAFQLPSIAGPDLGQQLGAGFEPGSTQHVADSINAGKGVILTLPHAGNWDMAGVWLVQMHGQFTTVAERLKPESLFDAFVEFRNSLGFEVLPLTGGAEPPMRRLEEVLRSGGVVCLMGERDLTGRGVPVDFFDETASLPAGPATLAKKTGAALHTASSYFTTVHGEDNWGFKVGAPIDTSGTVEKVTQEIARQFEANIAQHPADWHMLQPLFHSDLSDRRKQKMGLLDD